jgi:hypothetical protein
MESVSRIFTHLNIFGIDGESSICRAKSATDDKIQLSDTVSSAEVTWRRMTQQDAQKPSEIRNQLPMLPTDVTYNCPLQLPASGQSIDSYFQYCHPFHWCFQHLDGAIQSFRPLEEVVIPVHTDNEYSKHECWVFTRPRQRERSVEESRSIQNRPESLLGLDKENAVWKRLDPSKTTTRYVFRYNSCSQLPLHQLANTNPFLQKMRHVSFFKPQGRILFKIEIVWLFSSGMDTNESRGLRIVK